MIGLQSRASGKEGYLLRRDRARKVAGVAAAVLLALALAGCGRHGATPAPTPGAGASTEATGGASSIDPGGQPTMDPVASELDQINQLINDLNNSISSSSDQGGE
jgi:predicted small lipoprotein YifL